MDTASFSSHFTTHHLPEGVHVLSDTSPHACGREETPATALPCSLVGSIREIHLRMGQKVLHRGKAFLLKEILMNPTEPYLFPA